jgi:patatin-like phospholipase/acyl hydrolase
VFKTRHHPDYAQDWRKPMVDIALATSAAPTIYRPLDNGGYRLIDGGVWANNPTMLAVVEAMTAYDVSRERIKVLSIGCGDEPYIVAASGNGEKSWVPPCERNPLQPPTRRGFCPDPQMSFVSSLRR